MRQRSPVAPAAVALALALAVVAIRPAGAQQEARVREFDAYAAKAVRDWQVPGLAIAVVQDGRIVFAKGYGVRELGKPAPVDTQTLFAIGSTTKAMTAASIGMLVDEGKVRWDDPVSRHLPQFQLQDPYVTREVTVRDLLTHRAGLGNADFLWYAADNTPAEVLRRLRYVRPAYSMRSSFIYQNIMYAAAGEVVGAASGTPWARFVRERIFTPLGMTRTVPSLAEAERQQNVAAPHDRVHDTIVVIRNASVDPVAPAGAVWSSVGDMAKWMLFVLDSGRVGGRALLKPRTFAELLTPQTMVTPEQFYPTAQLTRPHWMTYGLGWFQEDYDGRAVDFHTGSIDGMVAIVGLIPDERLGVYVLANLDHAEVRHALMYRAFDVFRAGGALMNQGPTRDWSAEFLRLYNGIRARGDSAQRAAEARRVTGTRPTLALDRYAGTYADSLYGTVTVAVENGALTLRTGSRPAVPLEHWEYDTFRARWAEGWRDPSPVQFILGPGGRVARLEMGGGTYRRSGER